MFNAVMKCSCSSKWNDAAPLILRIALGSIFMYHGYMKFFVMGMPAVTGFFASVGIPLASIMAPLVATVELVGGAMLILGLFTHWISKAGVAIAIVAFLTVHMAKGFDISKGGYEFIMLIGAVAFSLMVTGAGAYSADSYIKGEEH